MVVSVGTNGFYRLIGIGANRLDAAFFEQAKGGLQTRIESCLFAFRPQSSKVVGEKSGECLPESQHCR